MAKSTKVNSVVAPVRKAADADKTAGGAKARSKLDEDENDKPEPEKKKKRKLGLNKPAFHWDPILSVSAGRAKKRCWADGRVSMALFPRHCPRQDLLTGQGAWARGMLGSVQPRREVSADFSSPYCQPVCIWTSPSAQLAVTGRGGERTVRPKVECRVLKIRSHCPFPLAREGRGEERESPKTQHMRQEGRRGNFPPPLPPLPPLTCFVRPRSCLAHVNKVLICTNECMIEGGPMQL